MFWATMKFQYIYTQIKKTVNTENIPGMCVLTNHMRDLVTAENKWVLSHGIELFRKTRFTTIFTTTRLLFKTPLSTLQYASVNHTLYGK